MQQAKIYIFSPILGYFLVYFWYFSAIYKLHFPQNSKKIGILSYFFVTVLEILVVAVLLFHNFFLTFFFSKFYCYFFTIFFFHTLLFHTKLVAIFSLVSCTLFYSKVLTIFPLFRLFKSCLFKIYFLPNISYFSFCSKLVILNVFFIFFIAWY